MRAEYKGATDSYELVLRAKVVPVQVQRDAALEVTNIRVQGVSSSGYYFDGSLEELDNLVDALTSLREQVQNG